MHGLINKSLQSFLRDTYGPPAWDAVAREAALGFASFESMLTYDDALTEQVITAAVTVLKRKREALLEDLGTYIVSQNNPTSLRRLLRFSGVNFADFLNSLEELPERGRLVLSDLDLPDLELVDHGTGLFTLRCVGPLQGVGHIVLGLLRAMADDYGALVILDHLGASGGGEAISIQIADQAFTPARPFSLGIAGH
ncbi:MAG: heme NO-binding domain-containing protein [Paracoccaceae bacterium]